jgi:hypothetical protein
MDPEPAQPLLRGGQKVMVRCTSRTLEPAGRLVRQGRHSSLLYQASRLRKVNPDFSAFGFPPGISPFVACFVFPDSTHPLFQLLWTTEPRLLAPGSSCAPALTLALLHLRTVSELLNRPVNRSFPGAFPFLPYATLFARTVH